MATRTTTATPGGTITRVRGGDVIVQPYLTEKSARLAELGQYTFIVHPQAEKVGIARAIAARYAVHPVHVTIVNTRGKNIRAGSSSGQRSSVKKAVVTLKKGEKLPFGVKS